MNYSLFKRKRKLKGQIRMDNTKAQRVYAHKTQNGRKKAKKKTNKKKQKKPSKNKLTHKTPPKTRKTQSSITGSIKNRWYTPGAILLLLFSKHLNISDHNYLSLI